MKLIPHVLWCLIVIISGVYSPGYSQQDQQAVSIPSTENYYNIIPAPLEFKLADEGRFILNSDVVIVQNKLALSEILYLQTLIQTECGLKLEIVKKAKKKTHIKLDLNTDILPNEHHIICDQTSILIAGGSTEALFNGIQTLRQILSVNTSNSEAQVISAFSLSDQSKFKWRGMLLDVCRHYFPKEVVLKYIDLLAFYKFNVLHWHITEDQAWRIAIDAYPNLTEVGAWRTLPTGQKYGGFYTKEDIREIVSYASERHIQVIPEIEMPGHSSAAVASYPFLGCNEEQISVPTDWGVFKDIYCPTEETFTFLEVVLAEVMELFPSNYVHIGGDEAPKTRWEESEFCQNLMKKENLHDYEELQSYFINRMAAYLEKNGKTIIGWDEILNDELTPSAIIQSWRGMEGGKKAVSEGRNAIMSPTSHCYLDYSLKAIDTEKLYHFNPIPPNCNEDEAQRILGAECNMWTEHVPTEDVLDSKVFPRLIAASEAFWSTKKDYSNFLERLEPHYRYLEKRRVNYGEETMPISMTTSASSKEIKVTLTENIKNTKILYKLQPSKDKTWNEYENTISISKPGKHSLIMQAHKYTKTYGELERLNFNIHSFMDVKPTYSVVFSDYYTAGGETGLTDGVLGSLDFRDGHWQGFFGDDVELILENPNESKSINTLSMNFYRYINSWIFPPEIISVSVSEDGETYQELKSFSFEDKEKFVRGKSILPVDFKLNSENAPFIKITITNIGTVPNWHEASGEPAWIFIDELIIN